ncbi:MAG: hypothetical protein ACR2RE_09270 [Geminicoccaceae bacterium]
MPLTDVEMLAALEECVQARECRSARSAEDRAKRNSDLFNNWLTPEPEIRDRRRSWTDPFDRVRNNALTLENYHQKKNDPEYRERRRAADSRTAACGEVKAKKKEADRIRNQRPKVQERRRELQRARYDRVKDDPEFRANARQCSRDQYKKNPDYYLAKGAVSARRRRHLFSRLSGSEKQAVKVIYQVARQLTRQTGVPHEVDHVIPLHGENVSGLHMPLNLRVITSFENRSKGNRICL